MPVKPLPDCRIHRRTLAVAQTGLHIQLQVFRAAGSVVSLDGQEGLQFERAMSVRTCSRSRSRSSVHLMTAVYGSGVTTQDRIYREGVGLKGPGAKQPAPRRDIAKPLYTI